MEFIKWMASAEVVIQFQTFFGIEAVPDDVTVNSPMTRSKSKSVLSTNLKNTLEKTDQKHKDLLSGFLGSQTVGGTENDDCETDITPQKYKINNRFWYYLFKIASLAGHEIFYIIFFPFWFWNIDGAVGRRVTIFWMMTMYIGQALKEVFRVPRPACPPCLRLDTLWVQEYGLPSTHACVALAIPATLLLYSNQRYQLWWGCCLVAVVFWCVTICVSRIYLGMHSLLDVVAGVLLSLCLLVITPVVDALDHWLLSHPASPVVMLAATVTLAWAYPSGDQWTSARGDTAVILGTCTGFLLGSWCNYQCGVIGPPPSLGHAPMTPHPIMWPSVAMTALVLVRTALGLATVLAVRSLARDWSIKTVLAVLQVPRSAYLSRTLPLSHHARVEVTYKVLTYAVIGAWITAGAPAMFRLVGIGRETIATEV